MPCSFHIVPSPKFLTWVLSRPCCSSIYASDLFQIPFLEFLFKPSSITVPYILGWPESSFGFLRAILWKTEMNFLVHSVHFFYPFPEGSSPFLKILSHSRCLTTSTDPSKLPPVCLLPFWTSKIFQSVSTLSERNKKKDFVHSCFRKLMWKWSSLLGEDDGSCN